MKKKNKRKLAEECYVSNDTYSTKLNNNDLIIGCSGSGKTRGYVMPLLASTNDNIVVVDTKNQLYNNYYKNFKERGYDVFLLDFVNPKNSSGYNPLEYIRFDNGEYNTSDIASLANNMMFIKCTKDPYWTQSGKSVIEVAIALVLEALPKEEHDMNAVLEIFNTLTNPIYNQIIFNWMNKNRNTYSAIKWELFKNVINTNNTYGCILSFAGEALSIFSKKEYKYFFDATRKDIFHISELASNKKIALFINVSDSDRETDPLVSIVYKQLFQELISYADSNQNGQLVRPVRIILDDFAANVKIEDFDKLISVIRSRNISTSIIIQNITQLNSLYSRDIANTIVNNCDHTVYLGGQDISTINFIAERSGINKRDLITLSNDAVYVIERGSLGKKMVKSSTEYSL